MVMVRCAALVTAAAAATTEAMAARRDVTRELGGVFARFAKRVINAE